MRQAVFRHRHTRQQAFELFLERPLVEQYSDIIQWDQSNRAYIPTHGVSGVDWKHYKHPLPSQSNRLGDEKGSRQQQRKPDEVC